MKVLIYTNCELDETAGITKKIMNQQTALRNLFGYCDLFYLKNDEEAGLYINDICIKRMTNFRSVNLFLSKYIYDDLVKYVIENSIDVIYIRYTYFCNMFFLHFLKKMQKNNVKIYLEIPTYPYDGEFYYRPTLNIKRIVNYYIKFSEKHTRKYLKRYINRIVTFTNEDEIFGVKTLKISNSVSEELPISLGRGHDKFVMIGVAKLASWHGYDRLIKAIYDYKNSEFSRRDVVFKIVGDGEILLELEMLVKKLDLESEVQFLGARSGSELDDCFIDANVGIDSLARHRFGNDRNNSLKSKEYLMRGLPIVKSHIDESVESFGLHYQVSPDEESINLKDIIEFVDKFPLNPLQIREVALRNFTWEKQFEILVE